MALQEPGPPISWTFTAHSRIYVGAAVASVATVSVAYSGLESVYLGPSHGDRTRHVQQPSNTSDRTTATPGPSLIYSDDNHSNNNNNNKVGYVEELEGGLRRKGSSCIKRNLTRFMAAVSHGPRPHLRRNSPLAAYHSTQEFSAGAPMVRRIDVSDSDSDDEPPPAIQFSKVTEALLNNGPLLSSPPRQDHQTSDAQRFVRSTSAPKNLDTPSRAPAFKILRKSSPSALGSSLGADRGHTPPRIVHIGSGQKGSGRRTISIAGPYPQRFAVKRDPTPQPESKPELVTPAPAPRAVRVTRTRSGSNASQDGLSQANLSTSRPGSRDGYHSSSDQRPNQLASSLSRHTSLHHAPETVSRYVPSTINRSRNASAEAAPPPGSTRIKRAPIGTGTFLKSGPVRRGFRRRDSDDNVSPAEDYQTGSATTATNHTPLDGSTRHEASRSRSGSVNTRATSVEPVSVHDYAQEKNTAYESRCSSRQASNHPSRSQIGSESRPSSRQASHDFARGGQPSVERQPHSRQHSAQAPDAQPSIETRTRRPSNDRAQPKPLLDQKLPQRQPSLRHQYRYAAPKVHTDASEDQENMPPPTFKRNKDQEFKYLGRPAIPVMSDDEKPQKRTVQETPVPVPSEQHERRALGAISGNTPHRAAPAPPPKMSVLETATATGGASTTKSRKKRVHITLKGKVFTQMSRIGKGGTSDVYCVMAENFKTFALKRVKLEDADESAVRGYKGEIDLLKQLTDVERVIRLIDWEINNEKQELLVLMEKGDSDFNRLLTLRISGVDAKFDSVFVRFYWKEMLECLLSVHDHDIVHSDLKPANFLMVQGRLKLIDFGIANAIDTDNTCNVHREFHVGTPNYMSPESITDTSATAPGAVNGRDAEGRPLKKDMKLGKASDIWSLGCILYQMIYGRPPFAHIANQITRIMAITNPKVQIEYPERGVGSVIVPASLKGTLRRCLQRDPELRPTAKQLLSETDSFLFPEANGAVMMTEDLLRQIIDKVVNRCRDPEKGMPPPEEVRNYPGSFMAKIREMVEKG